MRKKELEELLEESERSKKEMFIHFSERVAYLREELNNARTGASQINLLFNAILVGAALDHDGSITIPKNYLELGKKYEYEVRENDKEYVLSVIPRGTEDDVPTEEGK